SLQLDGTFATASGSYSTAPNCSGNDLLTGGYFLNGNDTGGVPGFGNTSYLADLRIYRNRYISFQELLSSFYNPNSRWACYQRPRRAGKAGVVGIPPKVLISYPEFLDYDEV